jgi:hypothetical protein
MAPAQPQKVASSLINKSLVHEIRAKPDAPVWHEKDDGHFPRNPRSPFRKEKDASS